MSIRRNTPWVRKYFGFNGADYCCDSEQEIQAEKNVKAFMHVIRRCEGTDTANGYLTLFGYELFGSFEKHPNILIEKGGYSTTAAGAYQILYKTWETVIQPRLNLPDFSPESQDKACRCLIEYRGALQDVKEGRLKEAVKKCSYEWASLPFSPYGQPVKTMEEVERYFKEANGKLNNTLGESSTSENK